MARGMPSTSASRAHIAINISNSAYQKRIACARRRHKRDGKLDDAVMPNE